MPEDLESHQEVNYRNKVILFAGIEPSQSVSKVWIIHFSGEVEKGKNLRYGRNGHSVHMEPGEQFCYILGGQDAQKKLQSRCEAYDLNDLKSKTFAKLKKGRLNCGTMKINGQFYVFGGTDLEGNLIDNVECLS